MIPVPLYRSKLDELDDVLKSMGKNPEDVSQWVFDAESSGKLDLAAIREKGAQSIALVKALPKMEEESILGLKLTEDVRADQAMRTLGRNQEKLYEEIASLERIERLVMRLHDRVARRIDAVKVASENLREQAAGPEGDELRRRADELEREVIPVLVRLRDELYHAVQFIQAERKIRYERIDWIDRRQLVIPKYNRRARQKRAVRKAKKLNPDLEVGDDDGAGGAGGAGDE